MIVVKDFTFNENKGMDQIRRFDANLAKLFQTLQGRVRFGDVTDGKHGENISGEFQVFTTSATPDAANTISHTLGAIPVGFLVLYQSKVGNLYGNPDGTGGVTAWSDTQLFLKCNIASVTFGVFLLK